MRPQPGAISVKHILSAALAVACAAPALAGEIPVRDFARYGDWEQVKLSPNGDYVAASKRVGDHWVMGFIRLADFKVTGGLNFGTFDHVTNFWWVGPDRVVATLGQGNGFFGQPHLTGELYAINADGGGKQYLVGGRGSAATGLNAYAEMVDPTPRDPGSALIKVSDFGVDVTSHRLYLINTDTGVLTRQEHLEADHVDYYLTDGQGHVRYAAGVDDKYQQHAYALNADGNRWSELNQGQLGKATIEPLSYSGQEHAAYFASDEIDLDRYCLVRQDVKSGQRAPVACDPEQSLADTLNDVDGRPIAAVFAAGRPDTRVLAPGSAEGKALATLLNTFPSHALDSLSWSLDGTKLLFRAYSDRDPGSYYLLDTAKGKLKRLMSLRPWTQPEKAAERRPVSYAARDGRRIHGYLTLPNGREPKKLPLVVLAHGGPFFVRDSWGWDADAQLLASRGYAVLQVNFRGSSGYGNAHATAGHKNWGVDMINDITDGLRHVVQHGYADPQRVCIAGASFGGYAAMMSAVREPDAYKCVVTFAGVYDIASFKERTDITDSKRGEYYFSAFVADSPEREREQSPLTHLDRLKAAVLIVHGKADARVPYQQAQLLRDALSGRDHPFEFLATKGEGHGFFYEHNRVEFYDKMLAFLDRHIGKPASPIATQ
jgi:dipeptidyl aminopeptidase/acylaminoacyl peptidase